MSTTLFLILFILLFCMGVPTYAEASEVNSPIASSPDIQVDQVSHIIKIQQGALVVINDTLKLSPKAGENTVSFQSFSLGFPLQYTLNLDYCFAYEASNPETQLDVELDVGLGRLGYYGVSVLFPEPGVNIVSGQSYSLTVIFIFSNLIQSESAGLLEVNFPMYPSLTQNASVCNVAVILPPEANSTNSIFHERKLDFNITTQGDSQILRHSRSPLETFEYEPAWLNFNLDTFPVIEFTEITREITLNQWRGVYISNSYFFTNKGYDLSSVTVGFPEGAYNFAVRDEFGPIEDTRWWTEDEKVTVSLRSEAQKDHNLKIFLGYHVPWEKYINQRDGLSYNLNFNFYERFNWTIRKLIVSITLPEGSDFQTSSPPNPHSIEKSVFQETLTFSFFNVTPFHDLNFDLKYGYSLFWASFRPTLWMGVLVIIASAITLLRRVPKPPTAPMVAVPLEDLRGFVEAYEGKTRILSELESMEEQLRRGRIPRRRYKVRRKMLEGRLSTLSRDLSDLRGKIRAAGRKYANNMRQIEVAETMLEGVEKDIRRVESRYRRGEISKGAYGRLMEEYNRRRERAMTTIDGVLLRLREDIR